MSQETTNISKERAMGRLTENIRRIICLALIKHRFEAQKAQLKEREFDLALELYETQYPTALRKQMSLLPEGFLPTSCAVNFVIVNDGEKWPRRNLIRLRHYLPLANIALIGNTDHYLQLKSDSRLTKKVERFMADAAQLMKDEDETKKQTNDALKAFTTIKNLLKGWPEVEPFVPRMKVKQKLPSVPRAALNSALKLPAIKAAGASA